MHLINHLATDQMPELFNCENRERKDITLNDWGNRTKDNIFQKVYKTECDVALDLQARRLNLFDCSGETTD